MTITIKTHSKELIIHTDYKPTTSSYIYEIVQECIQQFNKIEDD